MEKGDRLNARDVDAGLCVMLLMLQSANRQANDTLRMFKDRGDVRGFFPDEGDQEAQTRVLKETPNLDAYAPRPRPMAPSGPWSRTRSVMRCG
jgi:type III restriction enzyme